ncbi:MAG: hypothetical protein K0S44_2261 [Bacteroidetes bacterium]|nr:hypothetical protein [Bacteroidota bacterium]
MKNLLILILVLCMQLVINAQSSAYLDINNVKARVNTCGDLFWDLYSGDYEVPKGSGIGTIFADNLWIGGYDTGGQLKIAAQTYRQTGTDFWPGPLDSNATTNSTVMADMNRVWKLNKCDIDAYHTWVTNGIQGPFTVDSLAVATMISWPAFSPFGDRLAPFVDFDNDGTYNINAGDYPLIKGDQAIYFIYNDKGGVHTETGGVSIGVEIHAMVYGYSCPDSALQNSVFVNYKIINKSSFDLNNAFIGKWTDFDMGGYNDDYVGCDVTRGAYYAYNGDSIDEGGYGIYPGAQGVVFLKGAKVDDNGIDDPSNNTANGQGYGDGIVDNEELGVTRFMSYYNSSHSVTGNPNTAQEFFNYLSGQWLNGTLWNYGGVGTGTGNSCDFMYPGDSDPTGFGVHGSIPLTPWDETIVGNPPGDRRGLASTGPFTFQPGDIQEFEVAYVFGRDYTNLGAAAGVQVMKNRIDSIRSRFANGFGIESCGCTANALGIEDGMNTEYTFSLYPNPSSDVVYIDYQASSKDITIEIYDVRGQLLKSLKINSQSKQAISVADLSSGKGSAFCKTIIINLE